VHRDRQRSASSAGRVSSATGLSAVTPAGAKPVSSVVWATNCDWLEGVFSSMPGIIIEKSFAEKHGKNYGTPAGSIMCAGAYMFKSLTPGAGAAAVRDPHYWDPAVHPLAGQITIKGVPDITSLTTGLLTGAIQGTYGVGLPPWADQLGGAG
jgi:peptide/nickel transport system substrate-binding protein